MRPATLQAVPASPAAAPASSPIVEPSVLAPARPALSEAEIVAAALAIVEESGVDGLTMRRLSEKLGVALGATYHHVPNKHALLVLVANQLYRRIEIPERVDGEWRCRLRDLILNVTEVMRAYPGLAAYTLRHLDEIPMVGVPDTMRQALDDAGLRGAAKERAVSALFFYLAGTIMSGVFTTQRPERLSEEMLVARFADGLDVLLAGVAVEVERAGLGDS